MATEATALMGCSRQETHRLIADGVVAVRAFEVGGRRLQRINAADLVSILNARHGERRAA